MNEKEMIDEIILHLDDQVNKNVGRMSVNMSNEEISKQVSYKCCHMYGREATETVGLLDMYADCCVNEPDNEYTSFKKSKKKK